MNWFESDERKLLDQFFSKELDFQDLVKQLQREDLQPLIHFVSFFEDELTLIQDSDLVICTGSQCVLKGSYEILRRVTDYNRGKLPEDMIQTRIQSCLNECDRAPCARSKHRLYSGESFSWLDVIERDGL